MAHIELRDLRDDDRDAAFRAATARTSAWPRAAFGDRGAFDLWVADETHEVRAVVEDGTVVGMAAGVDVEGSREIVLAISPAADADAPAEALRLLTSHEADRPLYARVSTDDESSHAELVRMGFVEYRRDGDDVVFALPPTLE